MLAARVPQILQNFGARSTGQLSALTCGLNALGALARVFTSLNAGGGAGAAMVRSYALGAALNSVILAQILFYGKGRGATRGASRRKGAAPSRRAVAPAAAAAAASPSKGGKKTGAAASPAAPVTRRTPARKSKK